jgi:hypothetical protein
LQNQCFHLEAHEGRTSGPECVEYYLVRILRSSTMAQVW